MYIFEIFLIFEITSIKWVKKYPLNNYTFTEVVGLVTSFSVVFKLICEIRAGSLQFLDPILLEQTSLPLIFARADTLNNVAATWLHAKPSLVI